MLVRRMGSIDTYPQGLKLTVDIQTPLHRRRAETTIAPPAFSKELQPLLRIRRLSATLLLPAALLAALAPWLDVAGLPVYHAHGGALHTHAGGGMAHGHDHCGSEAAGHTHHPHPSLHAHLHEPVSAPVSHPEVDAHRREHELMNREDILARMVPVGGASSEEEAPDTSAEQPETPCPAAPTTPLPEKRPTSDAGYCSLSQALSDEGCESAWQAPDTVTAVPPCFHAQAYTPLLPSGIAGRAPPADHVHHG